MNSVALENDMKKSERRLIIVVRADPVICGHAGEARNLAEAAVRKGYTDVRLLTWPLARIEESGLPTKPLESILPYSPPIVVERPEPVGDYKVIDGRFTTAMTGRLLELLTDGMDTVVMSMYLLPHMNVVDDAVSAARRTGLPVNVSTIAEAVGSDITNVVRSCVSESRLGPAAYLFSTYLSQDVCVAVSQYTKDLIVEAAAEVDATCGTAFAKRCQSKVGISYPAIDASAFVELSEEEADETFTRRELRRDGYFLFLSRLAAAKGVDDLIDGYRASKSYGKLPLIVAGSGPALPDILAQVGNDPWIRILTDVSDDEKKALMFGAAAYVLPSKPRPEFVETFGIALAEKMLVGGRGPVITTRTGGIPEAVGDCALSIEAGSPASITAALDHVMFEMSELEKQALAVRARSYALSFDRHNVFELLTARIPKRVKQPLVAAG